MTKTNLFAQHPEINLRKEIEQLHLPDNDQLIGREDVWSVDDNSDNVSPDSNSGKSKSE